MVENKELNQILFWLKVEPDGMSRVIKIYRAINAQSGKTKLHHYQQELEPMDRDQTKSSITLRLNKGNF